MTVDEVNSRGSRHWSLKDIGREELKVFLDKSEGATLCLHEFMVSIFMALPSEISRKGVFHWLGVFIK